MPEAASAAFRLAQLADDVKLALVGGLQHELGDVLSALDNACLPADVQQGNFNLAPIVRVDHTDALADNQALFRAQAAAGINEPGNVRPQDLYGQAGPEGHSLAESDPDRAFSHTGTEVSADGIFLGVTQDIVGAGVVEDFYVEWNFLFTKKALPGYQEAL